VPEAPPAGATSWEEQWRPYLPGSPILRASHPESLSAKQKEAVEHLEHDWQRDYQRLAETWKRVGDLLGELPLTVKKGDVKVTACGIAWVPFWIIPGGVPVPAYRT